jgi:dTDP-4-dehydrorhamnose reductase
VLIVGGESQIGRALSARLRTLGAHVVVTTRKEKCANENALRLDLAEPVSDWPLPNKTDCAVFCAAVGNMETCQMHPEATRRVNVVHTTELAKRLASAGAFCVLLSTNMVFDGNKPLVSPEEPPLPSVEYGRQKAEAEQIFLDLGAHGAVVRLTKVLMPGMPLITRWKSALTRGDEVEAFEDYVCSPVALDAVVEGLVRLSGHRGAGVWQFSPHDQLSYAAIARELAHGMGLSQNRVRGVSCLGKVPHTPRFTSLDATRARNELDLEFVSSTAVTHKIFSS